MKCCSLGVLGEKKAPGKSVTGCAFIAVHEKEQKKYSYLSDELKGNCCFAGRDGRKAGPREWEKENAPPAYIG